MAPERIQRKRTRGWRLPEGAVCVDRSSRFGNPWRVEKGGYTREQAVQRFEEYLAVRRNPPPGWTDFFGYPSDEEIRRELDGKDLACWCPLPAEGEPDVCHAAVLLALIAMEAPDA